jgi:hypothetical protein
MAYTEITNTEIEPGKPLTTSLVTRIRDNPIAIANGDTGAPKVQTAAIQDNAVTNPKIAAGAVNSAKLATGTTERDWVLARTAGATIGVVGSYAICSLSGGGTLASGATVAGSSLRYATVITSGASGDPTLPGTWRNMGKNLASTDNKNLFLRIS